MSNFQDDMASPVWCDLDIESDGKRSGYINVSISSNESAYGLIPIPITVVKNGDGPTISLTGGVHGDEFEGPIVLMKLASSLSPENIKGRVLIIPSINLPAVLAGNRCSPIDDLNLNRIFPGRPDGSVSETIADFITRHIGPISDVHFDLHSGGKSLEYLPTFIASHHEDEDIQAKCIAAGKAFGAEITLVNEGYPDSGRYLTSVFTKPGALTLSTELGGAGKVNPVIVKTAESGVKNILIHFGVLQDSSASAEAQKTRPTRVVNIEDPSAYLMATEHGLFEPFIELGDEVKLGQVIGQIHYPAHNDKKPTEVISPKSGFLLCNRPPGIVERGDTIAIVALEEPSD